MKSIRFDTRQVRATLDGTMTEIRVPIKPQPNTRHCRIDFENGALKESSLVGGCWTVNRKMNPFYQPGDILYVKETWCPYEPGHIIDGIKYAYRANIDTESERCRQDYIQIGYPYQWHPSIHMPKEAARLFLRVTEVRVERVQEITEDGAKAEGCINTHGFIRSPDNAYAAPLQTAKEEFASLWDGIYKDWSINPWAWVIKFEKVEADYGEKLQSV